MTTQLKSKEYIFFDMDGTLVDTDYANFLAYQKAIKSVLNKSIKVDFDPTERFNSYLLKKHYPKIRTELCDKIIQLKQQLFSEFLSETVLIPEASERLKQCHQNKKACLVTNSSFLRASQVMSFHGLNQFITKVFCSDHRLRAKSKYHHAMEALQADNGLVEVFENEHLEVANAMQAGIQVKNIIRM